MRTKSEDKRREIVHVAAQAFLDLGYERTSMLTIAERMNGSKQTLYNYFPSKEDLLRAVLDVDVREVADQALDEFRSDKNLRRALVKLGQAYLSKQLAPMAISNFRTVANQPPESDIGKQFYKEVLCVAWKRLADEFEALMKEGKLRRADPWLATMHFRGLVLQDLLERELLSGGKSASVKETELAAKQAADAFLLIYGPRAGDPA